MLEELEKDVKAVRKAREALGDKAPVLGGRREGGEREGRGAVLGKRRREGREWKEEEGSGESDVPEEVRRVPMPRDTPPPIPKEVLDRWYQARRDRYAVSQVERREREGAEGAGAGRGANMIPLGDNARVLPPRPVSAAGGVPSPTPPVEVKTVYEAAPVLRDLRKEAVSFVPAAVRMKMDKSKGKGGLMEAEEADELERAGYLKTRAHPPQAPEEPKRDRRAVTMEEAEDEEY